MITVLHNDNFLDRQWKQDLKDLEDDFANSSRIVANVATDDFEEAFRLTNNINCSWSMNSGVILIAESGCRSTSVGDFMIRHGRDGKQNELVVVTMIGFVTINRENKNAIY